MPIGLQTIEFEATWRDWLEARRENPRHGPVTVRAALEQLAQLASIGEARAIAALKHSIANQYQGVYEPKNGSPPRRFPPGFDEQGHPPGWHPETAAKFEGI